MATFCSECGTSLPVDSRFCPKCGQAIRVAAAGTVVTIEEPQLFCPKCGSSLPEDSECLKCKREKSAGTNSAQLDASRDTPPGRMARPGRARSKGRSAIWMMLAVLVVMLAAGWWVATSNSPDARELRETISGLHSEAIVDEAFSVKPRNISVYKFSVPPNASNVIVVGQFDTGNAASGQVEVYVLSDAALVIWQNGYSATNYYESGRVARDSIEAALPSGAGVYYVVFSNKTSLRAPATVHASLTLRYNKWLPDWLLHLKESFWSCWLIDLA